MSHNDKICAVIVTYNRKEYLCEAIQALVIQNYPLTSIFIIDNNSTDGSAMMIRKRFPQVKLIVNQENLGFAKGNNIGIQWGMENKFDYFLILNNDTLVDKTLLVQLISAIGGSSSRRKVDKTIGVVSPKIY